jgi:hypothetical protein
MRAGQAVRTVVSVIEWSGYGSAWSTSYRDGDIAEPAIMMAWLHDHGRVEIT